MKARPYAESALVLVKQAVREIGVYLLFLRHAFRRPLILFNPCDAVAGWGSDLRAQRVARVMREELGRHAISVPAQLGNVQRRRIGRLLRPDVVIHQTFMNDKADPALYPTALNVVDLDDAHFNDPRLREAFERKARGCAGGIAGSTYTRDWLAQHVPETILLCTPTPVRRASEASHRTRPADVVVWATTSPLRYVREAELVRDSLCLAARERSLELHVIGDADPAEMAQFLAPLQALGARVRHSPHQSYAGFLKLLEQGAVGLAPLVPNGFSAGKSFGKVLAYIAAGLPVIASDVVDHPLFFRHGDNGYLAREPRQWADAILALLADAGHRDSVAKQAFADMQQHMGIRRFAEEVIRFVDRLAADQRQR